MATALYVPCLAISATSGGQIDLTLMIVIAGVLVTLYTMLGGIQAVIWNDVIQFSVMFGGLGATVWIVASTATGGVPEIWNAAHIAGKTRLWVPLGDPSATGVWSNLVAFFRQPMTVPALFFALIVGRAAQYTTDQTMALRIQSTRSTADARRAFIVNAAGDALWMLGLTFVGLALFAYFQHSPPPEGLASDRMLPYFMANVFPAGTVGLVTAAILAASLSSVDAAIHSGSSVLVVDIYNRLIKGRRMDRAAMEAAGVNAEDDRAQVRLLRWATVLMGVMGTALATNVEGIGNLLEIANKLINSFSGPLVRDFPAGNVQQARDQQRRARRRRGRRGHRVHGRLSELDWVFVAVDVRTGGHADRRRGGVTRSTSTARGHRALHLARRDAAISRLISDRSHPARDDASPRSTSSRSRGARRRVAPPASTGRTASIRSGRAPTRSPRTRRTNRATRAECCLRLAPRRATPASRRTCSQPGPNGLTAR